MKTLPLKIILVVASLMLPYTAQTARNILVFGDSLSAGYGIARDAAWASLLQKELQQSHPQIEVVNASISGETTSGGLRRIGKALQEHKPYIIIIELGANDALRGSSIGETENNLREIIEQSLKSKSKVILLGMQIPPNYGLDYSKKFRELYPMLAKQYKLSLVPFMLEGIPPEQFQADNLHPNEQAQARILKNIERALKPLL
jgi:acyl-CoA thioesterase-1